MVAKKDKQRALFVTHKILSYLTLNTFWRKWNALFENTIGNPFLERKFSMTKSSKKKNRTVNILHFIELNPGPREVPKPENTQIHVFAYFMFFQHDIDINLWNSIGAPESHTYKRAQCCPYAGFFRQSCFRLSSTLLFSILEYSYIYINFHWHSCISLLPEF